MTARILAVVNQKGGSGKTTLSINLAAEFGRMELRTLLVDADEQGTALQYAQISEDPDTRFSVPVIGLAAAGDMLHRHIAEYIDDYDVIVVDTPPSMDKPQPLSAMLVADLVLIPVQPSPFDLWALSPVQRTIAAANAERGPDDPLKVKVVLMNDEPRQLVSRSTVMAIEQMGLPLCDTAIQHRAAFKKAAAMGVSVWAMLDEGRVASREVRQVAREALVDMGLAVPGAPPSRPPRARRLAAPAHSNADPSEPPPDGVPGETDSTPAPQTSE